jgi:hypothetical protein
MRAHKHSRSNRSRLATRNGVFKSASADGAINPASLSSRRRMD